jgi:hypothetical protein
MVPEAGDNGAVGSGVRRLKAASVAAHALLDATSIEEAAPRILQAICESLGWEHGALWTVDRESDCLRCAEMWSAAPLRFREFRAASERTTFRRGVGLPGRVWASASPAWIPDVTADGNFPRARIAAAGGAARRLRLPGAAARRRVRGDGVLQPRDSRARRASAPDADHGRQPDRHVH